MKHRVHWCVAITLWALPAGAGRPLAIDDAEPVAPGHFEFESGAGYFGDGPLRHWDFPVGLGYGVGYGIEVAVGTGGQVEEREEFASGRQVATDVRDVTLGLKWKFMDEQSCPPAQALAFVAKIPTASRSRGFSSGELDFDLTWIASKRLDETFAVHANAGYTWLGDPPVGRLSDDFHAGVALGAQVHDRLELVGEVYGNFPLADRPATAFFNAGLRWAVTKEFTLDAALGAGLTTASPDWLATVGFTWTFGPIGRRNGD